MSRFALRVFFCTLVFSIWLIALPSVSVGQTLFGTHPKSANANTKPAPLIREGTAVIYSNFGSGYTYDCCDGWDEYGGFPVAMAFTPTKANYLLVQIDFVFVYFRGTDAMTMELCADNNGAPGKVLASWIVQDLPAYVGEPYQYPIQTLKPNKPIALAMNNQYWLVPIPASNAILGWNGNYDDIEGNMAFSDNNGATWETEVNWNGVFDVLGVPY